jgi:hypothetical protein
MRGSVPVLRNRSNPGTANNNNQNSSFDSPSTNTGLVERKTIPITDSMARMQATGMSTSTATNNNNITSGNMSTSSQTNSMEISNQDEEQNDNGL